MLLKSRQWAGFGLWIVAFDDPYTKQWDIYQVSSKLWNNTREYA